MDRHKASVNIIGKNGYIINRFVGAAEAFM
jgi:hypothetical protein